MVHGLAGSGALLISVLATSSDLVNSLAYLCIFGVGSILGMMVAAGVFSIPFSDKILKNETLRIVLTVLSAVLCIGLGSYVIYENLV
jgi:threonine/homoserine/homoserine lactone efflux protein